MGDGVTFKVILRSTRLSNLRFYEHRYYLLTYFKQACYRRRPAFMPSPAFMPDWAFCHFLVQKKVEKCRSFARLFSPAAGRRRRFSKNARLMPDFLFFSKNIQFFAQLWFFSLKMVDFLSNLCPTFIFFLQNPIISAQFMPDFHFSIKKITNFCATIIFCLKKTQPFSDFSEFFEKIPEFFKFFKKMPDFMPNFFSEWSKNAGVLPDFLKPAPAGGRFQSRA